MELLYFHGIRPFGTVADSELEYSVVAARHRGHWVCVRLKGRTDWCFPGGGREGGETMEENARRELVEETGARNFSLRPLGLYGVDHREVDPAGIPKGIPPADLPESGRPGHRGRVSWGGLYTAEVKDFGPIPEEFEIAERKNFISFPLDNARFPHIMPGMMAWLEANVGLS